MNQTKHKKLRRENDQYVCSHCELVWDIHDPEPDCRPEGIGRMAFLRARAKLKRINGHE